MLKVISYDRDQVLVEYVLPLKEKVTVNWYNPFYGYITNIRTAAIVRIHPLEEILETIRKMPKLRIYTVASHEPIITSADEEKIRAGFTTRANIAHRQRVKENDIDYIDEFGFHVYIQSYVGFKQNIDLRYEGEINKEPELLTLTPYQS